LFRDAKPDICYLRGEAGGTCGCPAAENSRRPSLRARAACRPIALWKAAGEAVLRDGSDHQAPTRPQSWRQMSDSSFGAGFINTNKESTHIFRGELDAQGRTKFISTESTEVVVEVAQRRRQCERLDPG